MPLRPDDPLAEIYQRFFEGADWMLSSINQTGHGPYLELEVKFRGLGAANMNGKYTQKKETHMTGLIRTLKALAQNPTVDLDDAIELSINAELLRDGYKRHQLSSPVWLDDAIRILDRFIGDQTRDRMEMELREIAQADAADMTSQERRDARAKRKAEIEARLHKPTE